MARPNVDDTGLPPDPPPGSDPEPVPRHPQAPKRREASAETLAGNVEVTPLDDEEHVEEGIEVKET